MKTLDLHRMRHEEAEMAVMKFIDHNYVDGCRLKIITGHSEAMRQIVADMAKEYDLPCKVGGILGLDKSYIVVNCPDIELP